MMGNRSIAECPQQIPENVHFMIIMMLYMRSITTMRMMSGYDTLRAYLHYDMHSDNVYNARLNNNTLGIKLVNALLVESLQQLIHIKY